MSYSKKQSSTKRRSTKRRSVSRRRNNKKIIKAATSIKHLIIMPMKEGGGKRSKKTRKLRRH
jgi:hypothetical protein